MKTFTSKYGLKQGLKRAGLEAMNYEPFTVERSKSGREIISAVVYVHDLEDKHEVESRGFTAKIDRELAAPEL